MKITFLFLLVTVLTNAQSYSAKKISVDSIEVVRLTDSTHKTEVSVVPSIGNNAYEMKVNGKNLFWTPFRSLAGFKAEPAFCGTPFLWPWANRIDQDAYYVNNRKYLLNADLGNFRRDPNGRPIHGLLAYSPDWKVISVKANAQFAEVTSRLDFWKYPELMAQFPFAHTVEMTYRLRDGVLEVETAVQNLSVESMPVTAAYHPYFRLHDAPRDDWKVHVAAREHVVLSKALLPTGELKPLDLPDPVSLRNSQLDDVFTGLIQGADQRAEFWVQGGKEKISVIYGPKYSVAVVYAPPGQDFICFEPMSALTNAFNLAHEGKYKKMQSIAPGAKWRESFWIKPTGF